MSGAGPSGTVGTLRVSPVPNLRFLALRWLVGALAGQVGLATSPEPSDSRSPGGPAFSFGRGGT